MSDRLSYSAAFSKFECDYAGIADAINAFMSSVNASFFSDTETAQSCSAEGCEEISFDELMRFNTGGNNDQ